VIMLKSFGCALVAAVLVAPSPALAGELRLSIANGRVTLIAQDVPLKQILDEWGRVGQTTIVGSDKLAGGNVTLELRDVPESKALETLLRSASGYIAKPRNLMAGGTGTSSYDRILIMAPSRAPAAPPPVAGTPFRTQQMLPPVPMDDDGEPTNVMPPGAVPYNGMPMAAPYPGQMPNVPGAMPNGQPAQQVPMTAPRPGMLPTPPPPAGNFPANQIQVVPTPPMPRTPGGPGGIEKLEQQ
jgi:hypothetical protein